MDNFYIEVLFFGATRLVSAYYLVMLLLDVLRRFFNPAHPKIHWKYLYIPGILLLIDFIYFEVF